MIRGTIYYYPLKSMRLPKLIIAACVLAYDADLAVAANNSEDRLISEFPNLVSWFRSHGGMSKCCTLVLLQNMCFIAVDYHTLNICVHHHLAGAHL